MGSVGLVTKHDKELFLPFEFEELIFQTSAAGEYTEGPIFVIEQF